MSHELVYDHDFYMSSLIKHNNYYAAFQESMHDSHHLECNKKHDNVNTIC